jgi:diacylglycerol kinase family enzyme
VRTVEMSDDGLEASLRQLVGDGASVIGVVGGDGSTGCAAGVAADLDVTLWPVPGGTLNHFSRDLGVATIDEAVDALEAGATRQVDIGEVAGIPFVNNASIGIYAEQVLLREHLEKRMRVGKWPCAALAMIRTIANAPTLDVDIDGRPERVFMVFVGNNRYSGFADGARPRLDEGVLDVVVLRAPHRYPRSVIVGLAAVGRLAGSRFVKRTTVERVRVSLREPGCLAHDGEAREIEGDVVFESRAGALRVIVPA